MTSSSVVKENLSKPYEYDEEKKTKQTVGGDGKRKTKKIKISDDDEEGGERVWLLWMKVTWWVKTIGMLEEEREKWMKTVLYKWTHANIFATLTSLKKQYEEHCIEPVGIGDIMMENESYLKEVDPTVNVRDLVNEDNIVKVSKWTDYISTYIAELELN